MAVYRCRSAQRHGSRGRFRSETVNAGDVAYIPQGYGHSIENIGSERARILLAFNTGEYQSIDLSDWMAGNPDASIAAHLDLPEEAIRALPRGRQFIVPT